MKFFVFGLLSLVLNISFLQPGLAQDISVEAALTRGTIALDSNAQLIVTVHGTQNAQPPPAPSLEGFDIQYLGPSTQVSVVNGMMSSSVSFIYSLYPQKTGKFRIPSVSININGHEYKTDPVDVEVVDSSSPVGPQSGASAPTPSLSLKDKIFLVLKLPKNEVYAGEELPVKVFLFVHDLAARDIQYPGLEQLGFTMGKYEQPRQYEQDIGGIRYNVIEFDTVIYPTRTGEIKIGPAKLDCNVLVKEDFTRRSGPGGFNNFFDDDFFNSFFSNSQTKPMTVESTDVALNVLPLPEEGKPEGFSGAVGQFDLDVQLGPNEVKAGDPITLRLKLSGKGNLSAVTLPALTSQEKFKTYDPQIKEENNTKILEQVLIPNTEELAEIPAIQFSYFDPNLQKYETITKGPFPVKVTKLPEEEKFKVIGTEKQEPVAQLGQPPETLGQDILFIKEEPGQLRRKGNHLYANPFYYFILLVFCLLWLWGCLWLRKREKLQGDVTYARRLLAPKEARRGLQQAEALMRQNKKVEFYDALFKTFQQYLADKIHLPAGAINFENVVPRLNSGKIETQFIQDLKKIFEECEMVRYAAAFLPDEHMQESLGRLTNLIDYLERHLRSGVKSSHFTM